MSNSVFLMSVNSIQVTRSTMMKTLMLYVTLQSNSNEVLLTIMTTMGTLFWMAYMLIPVPDTVDITATLFVSAQT